MERLSIIVGRSYQWIYLIGSGSVGTVQLMVMQHTVMIKSTRLWHLSLKEPKENDEKQSADVGIQLLAKCTKGKKEK